MSRRCRDASARRLYIAEASGRKLDITYRMAWIRGLKTTYYLRALSATSTEKSTLERGTLNAVSVEQSESSGSMQRLPESTPIADGLSDTTSGTPAELPLACSIDDPDCEACQ